MSKEGRYLKFLEELLCSSIDEEVEHLKKRISETIKNYEQNYCMNHESVSKKDFSNEAMKIYRETHIRSVEPNEKSNFIQIKKEATQDGISNKGEVRENLIKIINNERSKHTSEVMAFKEVYEECPIIEIVVNQVVAVELGEAKIVKLVKENLKEVYEALEFPLVALTSIVSAILIGGMASVMDKTTMLNGALIGIGAPFALAVGWYGLESAINVLPVKKNYEKNLEILKKYGLYEYVQQMIEMWKRQKQQLLEESKSKNGKKR